MAWDLWCMRYDIDMYVCMYVCMYACVYLNMYMCIYIHIGKVSSTSRSSDLIFLDYCLTYRPKTKPTKNILDLKKI